MQGGSKRMRGWLALVLGAGLCATAIAGEEIRSENLLKMKAGPCRFKILDAKGVKPLVGSHLILTTAADSKAAAKANADLAGFCKVDVPAGRYVLSVDGRNLAVLDSAETHTISECRIVVPEGELAVGGAETEESKKKGGAFWLAGGKMTPVIVGSVAVLAGGVGYAVYDNNKDDNTDTTPTPVPPPPPPKKNDDDDFVPPPPVSGQFPQ